MATKTAATECIRHAGEPEPCGHCALDAADVQPTPRDEQLRHALTTDCATVLDEGDIANVVATVLPILVAEYDRGIEAGDYFARRKIASRLGLGEVKP